MWCQVIGHKSLQDSYEGRRFNHPLFNYVWLAFPMMSYQHNPISVNQVCKGASYHDRAKISSVEFKTQNSNLELFKFNEESKMPNLALHKAEVDTKIVLKKEESKEVETIDGSYFIWCLHLIIKVEV